MGKYELRDSALREENGNPVLPEIARWIAGVRFKKRFFGGADPADVFKKLEELNALYEKALVAERVRRDLYWSENDTEEPNG